MKERVRRVRIVGDGIAGLSAAIQLQRRFDVVVVKKSPSGRSSQFCSGLWNEAQRFVQTSLIPVEFVKNSAYLSMKGKVLSTPPELCVDLHMGPSLAFARDRDILSALSCRVKEAAHDEEEDVDLTVWADGAQRDFCVDLGYTVIRGLSPCKSLQMSFQSWGNGYRFACVNAPGGCVQWFATVPKSEFSVDAEVDLGAPFVPRFSTAKVDLKKLAQLFSSWAFAVPLIESCIVAEASRAVASKFVDDDKNKKPGHVRIGDSFCVLDPILAVGASVGVEDAVLLGRVLVDQSLTWDQFERIRRARRSDLRKIASFVNWLSQTRTLEKPRNRVFAAVPESLKTAVLKKSIETISNTRFSKSMTAK